MTDEQARLLERRAAERRMERHPGYVLCRSNGERLCPVMISVHTGRDRCRSCAQGA